MKAGKSWASDLIIVYHTRKNSINTPTHGVCQAYRVIRQNIAPGIPVARLTTYLRE
ncbi:MAG TPA: hypothetical protein VKM55_30935 [Candidatus Lokiarchaeia archaeon]|nr:hypothetical protein [Candidatus Lokiarchaeia archaeon]